MIQIGCTISFDRYGIHIVFCRPSALSCVNPMGYRPQRRGVTYYYCTFLTMLIGDIATLNHIFTVPSNNFSILLDQFRMVKGTQTDTTEHDCGSHYVTITLL